ncbi:MAG: two-component system sensor histidine kinase NtrB [Alphaproteobacteria bacterium]
MTETAPTSAFGTEGRRSDLVDALPHAVLLIGAEGEILEANVAAETFFDASVNMLREKTLASFVPFGSPLLAMVDQARLRGAPVNGYRVNLGTPRNGSDRVVDIHATQGGDVPDGVVVVIQERSMADKIDRQLTSRGAARSVSGLAAILAHEIKNPLAGIRGAAQLLETSAEADDRTLTQLICAEPDRIVRLVDRMEVFSDQRPIDVEPVNIHVVLDHVRKAAAAGFGRGVRFSDEFDPSLPLLLGNQDQLVQVFLNLVKNATESFGPDGEGEIRLTTAFKPGFRLTVPGTASKATLPLEFCVCDNGSGVPEDILPHLFDPFVTSRANGTGLGLALVAKIIGDHGGVIECTSSPGNTVFRVLMPAHQTASQEVG